jgi:sugar lactone lactonase YvrE
MTNLNLLPGTTAACRAGSINKAHMMEMDTMQNPLATTYQEAASASATRIRRMALCLASLGMAAVLAGCSSGLSGGAFSTGTTISPMLKVAGNVHGGQNPVAGATMQLWAVGTSGSKSVSAPLFTSTIQTDANGNFSFGTSNYSCTNATQVYLTATGGNPGGGVNSNLMLAAALGPCTGVQSIAFVQMNEVTTIAAAYALAPFAADPMHIGATGSNPTGLVNAFANAALLANISSGTAPGTGLATGVSVPVAEMNTLGNIIAACVNTTGAASTACTSLFGATATSDTFSAAMAIAKNPGASAVTALYPLNTPTAPFQPSLTNSSAPNDYSVAVTFAGSGNLATPSAIAIDASGNAWITNEGGTAVSQFSPSGALLSSSIFTVGWYGAQGIAISRTGVIWVAGTASNFLFHCSVNANGVGLQGCAGSNQGVSAPVSVAVDSTGQAYTANLNGNSVSAFTSSGGIEVTTTNSNITVPSGLAVDASGNVFTTSGTGGIAKLTNSGTYVASFTDNALQGPVALAVDSSGDTITAGFTTGSAVVGALQEFNPSGNPVFASPLALNGTPAGLAVAGSTIFIANGATAGGLQQVSYGASTLTSPAAGYGALNAPVGVAVDASGSVWTANSGSNTISKFVGISAPVVTPIAANVGP